VVLAVVVIALNLGVEVAGPVVEVAAPVVKSVILLQTMVVMAVEEKWYLHIRELYLILW
jgi:hypothetical protein